MQTLYPSRTEIASGAVSSKTSAALRSEIESSVFVS